MVLLYCFVLSADDKANQIYSGAQVYFSLKLSKHYAIL